MSQRFLVLMLLVSLSALTYLDRVCIAVAGPRMQEDLGITPERWGWVLGVFAVAYGVFEIPTGALGDRLGQRRVLTRIVLWWLTFTSLTGVISNYYLLLGTRFLFGAGEAGAYPNMAGSIKRWFPATQRARAQGWIWAASRLGGALTPWLVFPMMAVAGWRGAFLIFGGLGFAWAAVWHAWYRDRPLQTCHDTATGAKEITDNGATVPVRVPWASLLRSRQVWLIAGMYWCYVWGSMFYLTWFPTYLIKGRGFAEKEIATFAALPFVLGALGNLLGGSLSDQLSRKYGLRIGRCAVGSASLALAALCLFATALVVDNTVAALLLGLGFGVMDCMLPAAWAVCLDIGGPHVGAVSGAMNSAGQAGGFVCSVLFGYIVAAKGDYNLPLLVIAAMVAISAGLFCLIDPARGLALEHEPADTAKEPACA